MGESEVLMISLVSDRISISQPGMQDFIETLLQSTKISRFAANIQFDIDEDPFYTEFPDFDNPPGMRRIVRYVVAMLPPEKTFSYSIQRFVNSRKGKQECSINISMTGGIMGDCNGLLDLSITPKRQRSRDMRVKVPTTMQPRRSGLAFERRTTLKTGSSTLCSRTIS
jgi:hypothetical protein